MQFSEDTNLENDEARDDRTDVLVGERIRALRRARGLSLQAIADHSGYSVGFLSQVERGLSSASVRALARLADALGVGIGDIFPTNEDFDDASQIVARVRDRKRIQLPDTGVIKELITPFAQLPRLDIYMMTLEPGGRSGDEPYSHDGAEAGLILEGGIELIVDGRKYVLGEGDSFRFNSMRPHQFFNAGERIARAIWVNFRES